jgi:succinyl-diaminopimelate desuccinylase
MELQKTLEEIVAIPSVTSNTKACKQVIEYVEKWAKDNDLKTKIYEKNNVYSIIVAKKIKLKYEVILNGHMDVVPAPDDQFKPKITKEKGKNIIWGRGTSDMKGSNVSIMQAFLECINEGCDLDMALLFTTDEETGGFDGMKYVVDQGLTADIVFIPDGGNNWSVCTDEKGVFQLKLVATGISAHGSRVWLGDNALDKLLTVYSNMREKFEKKWGTVTRKDNWKPTLNLGALNGGNAANKVPNEATMLLDIRYPTPVTQDQLEDILKKSLVKDVTWQAISTGAPLHTDVKNKYMKKWIDLIGNPILEQESGASDGRFLAQKGIDVILTRPNLSEPHIDAEWGDIDDLIKFKDKVKEWLKSI